MFSFSPRISEPFWTSNSVALSLPLFVISNVVGPAGVDSLAGAQPLFVSAIDTFLPPLASSLPPHEASRSAAATAAVTSVRSLATLLPSAGPGAAHGSAAARARRRAWEPRRAGRPGPRPRWAGAG